MNKKEFVKGAAILAISGVVCKVLGAIYRIPLGNILGTQGMGCYQMAYPVYSMLIVISTSGIPIAVSKLVSEECAGRNMRAADEVLRVSLAALLIVGLACGVFLYALSGPLAAAMGMPSAAFSLKMLAPSLVFVAAVSAYRGYLQGMQLMGATAVSQLAEQLVRLTIGLYIAKAWMLFGADRGAGGALLGVTISEVAGFLVVMGYYIKKQREIGVFDWQADRGRKREILKKLWKIAFPVTLGACAMALVSTIDSAVVMRTLLSVGYASDEASSLYGLLTGFVQPVINMPAVISAAMSMSIVPAIAAAIAGKRDALAKKEATAAYKLSVVAGLPCAVGLLILGEPILGAMFSSLQGQELAKAGEIMRILAPAVFFMSVSQVSTGIMQGMGRPVYPVIVMLLGAVIKLFSGVWLIKTDLGICGAAAGTLLCFVVCMWLNTRFVVQYANVKLSVAMFAKPAVASIGMGTVVYLTSTWIDGNLGTWIAILAGAVVYGILLLLTKCVTLEEVCAYLGRKRRS